MSTQVHFDTHGEAIDCPMYPKLGTTSKECEQCPFYEMQIQPFIIICNYQKFMARLGHKLDRSLASVRMKI